MGDTNVLSFVERFTFTLSSSISSSALPFIFTDTDIDMELGDAEREVCQTTLLPTQVRSYFWTATHKHKYSSGALNEIRLRHLIQTWPITCFFNGSYKLHVLLDK